MALSEALEILKEFNIWRRAEAPYDELGVKFKYSARNLGIAIDTITKHLEDTLYD